MMTAPPQTVKAHLSKSCRYIDWIDVEEIDCFSDYASASNK